MPKTPEGWFKVEWISGGIHHYDRGYPACGWNSRQQKDEHGRCLACVQATQKDSIPASSPVPSALAK